jgi:hypothetical protein
MRESVVFPDKQSRRSLDMANEKKLNLYYTILLAEIRIEKESKPRNDSVGFCDPLGTCRQHHSSREETLPSAKLSRT